MVRIALGDSKSMMIGEAMEYEQPEISASAQRSAIELPKAGRLATPYDVYLHRKLIPRNYARHKSNTANRYSVVTSDLYLELFHSLYTEKQ
jgi:hypothetical protein